MRSTLSRRDVEVIQFLIAKAIASNPPPVGRDGVLIGGSYNPQDGSAQSIFGDTAAITGEDGDQFAHWTGPVATTQLGDQYGPVGNERTVLIPTQSGYIKLFIHGPDDSPQAPAGERWITHRNASGQVDSYYKHTNDGPTVGDGLGGVLNNGGALHVTSTTGGHSFRQDDSAKRITAKSSGGHTVTWDDVAKTLTLQSASGHQVVLNDETQQILVKTKNGLQHLLDDTTEKITHTAGAVQTILDGQGNVLSHVATTVNLGAASGLLSSNAAFRAADISTYDQNLQTAKLNDYIKFANLLNSAGAVTSAQLTTILAALVAGWTHTTTLPTGSANVFIK